MPHFFFDLGGTLIDDPFADSIDKLLQDCKDCKIKHPFPLELLEVFFEYWETENLNYNFQFSSHYLQEESWPVRAAIRLANKYNLNIYDEIPFFIPNLLDSYRSIARKHIEKQDNVKEMKELLKWLISKTDNIYVASNDREFATKAMLSWAKMTSYFKEIYTSESLSLKYRHAEKPNKSFFLSLNSEIKCQNNYSQPLILIGDSEQNDIIPSSSMGFIAIRYFNEKQASIKANWLDTTDTTIAKYSYRKTSDLKIVLENLI